MIQLRGSGARKLRDWIYGECDGWLTCEDGTRVQVVFATPHLGAPIEGSGSVVAEVRSRAYIGWGEWKQLGRRVFKNSLLEPKDKLSLAGAFFMNKVLYLAGT